ncbi:hypothetical protein [Burkholderia sp. 572]|uniref:hypothetical protein n=1 Tax=Burkholderia sp. 572 TaxID=3156414 RepID=UPI0033977BB1
MTINTSNSSIIHVSGNHNPVSTSSKKSTPHSQKGDDVVDKNDAAAGEKISESNSRAPSDTDSVLRNRKKRSISVVPPDVEDQQSREGSSYADKTKNRLVNQVGPIGTGEKGGVEITAVKGRKTVVTYQGKEIAGDSERADSYLNKIWKAATDYHNAPASEKEDRAKELARAVYEYRQITGIGTVPARFHFEWVDGKGHTSSASLQDNGEEIYLAVAGDNVDLQGKGQAVLYSSFRGSRYASGEDGWPPATKPEEAGLLGPSTTSSTMPKITFNLNEKDETTSSEKKDPKISISPSGKDAVKDPVLEEFSKIEKKLKNSPQWPRIKEILRKLGVVGAANKDEIPYLLNSLKTEIKNALKSPGNLFGIGSTAFSIVVNFDGLAEGDPKAIVPVTVSIISTSASISVTVMEGREFPKLRFAVQYNNGPNGELTAAKIKPPSAPNLAPYIKGAQTLIIVGGIVMGAWDLTTGTIEIFDAKTRAERTQAYLKAGSGAAFAIAGTADLLALLGVGATAVPIIGAAGNIVGVALVVAGVVVTTVAVIQGRDNTARGIEQELDYRHESTQLEQVGQFFEVRTSKIQDDTTDMERRYGFKTGSVVTNNNSADYINSVNSDHNSASGQWKRGGNGKYDSDFNPDYIYSKNTHENSLDLDAAKPSAHPDVYKPKLNQQVVEVRGDYVEKKIPVMNYSAGVRATQNGWEPADYSNIAKFYGYKTLDLGHSETVLTNHVSGGSPYLRKTIDNNNQSQLIVVDEMPTTQPPSAFVPRSHQANLQYEEKEKEMTGKLRKEEEDGLPDIKFIPVPGTSNQHVVDDMSVITNDGIAVSKKHTGKTIFPIFPSVFTAASLRAYMKELVLALKNEYPESAQKYDKILSRILTTDDGTLMNSAMKFFSGVSKADRWYFMQNSQLVNTPLGRTVSDILLNRGPASALDKSGHEIKITSEVSGWNSPVKRPGETVRQALNRHIDEQESNGRATPDQAKNWRNFIASSRDEELDEVFDPCKRFVNRMVLSMQLNDYRYITDSVNDSPYSGSPVTSSFPSAPGVAYARKPDDFQRTIATNPNVPDAVLLKGIYHRTIIEIKHPADMVVIAEVPQHEVIIRLPAEAEMQAGKGLRLKPEVTVTDVHYGEDGKSVTLTFPGGRTITITGSNREQLEIFIKNMNG